MTTHQLNKRAGRRVRRPGLASAALVLSGTALLGLQFAGVAQAAVPTAVPAVAPTDSPTDPPSSSAASPTANSVCTTNFQGISNVVHHIQHSDGSTVDVADLHGNVRQGDVITTSFDLPEGCTETWTLAAYTNTGPVYDDSTASQQTLYDSASVVNVPGGHYTLNPVTVPPCFFQVDFIRGLAPQHIGPLGSSGDLSDRLYSYDNGGTNTCTTPSTSPPASPSSPPPTLPTSVQKTVFTATPSQTLPTSVKKTTFTNVPQLPNTGSGGTVALLASGLGLVGVGIGAELASRRLRRQS